MASVTMQLLLELAIEENWQVTAVFFDPEFVRVEVEGLRRSYTFVMGQKASSNTGTRWIGVRLETSLKVQDWLGLLGPISKFAYVRDESYYINQNGLINLSSLAIVTTKRDVKQAVEYLILKADALHEALDAAAELVANYQITEPV